MSETNEAGIATPSGYGTEMVTSNLVSAIIANFNGAKHLRSCLPSLLSQSYESVEVIVVDNASSDESGQVAREFGVRWLPLAQNIGLAAALNRGAAIAQGQFLLFLNNDMRFDRHFVAALVDPLINDNGVFATDGMQYPWEGGAPVHMATRLTKVRRRQANTTELVPGLYFYQESNGEIVEAFFASAACMMVRKTFFQVLGGFDERLPLGYEDAELCWRARLHDWKVLFVPRAICWHRVGGSYSSIKAQLFGLRGLVRGRLVLSTKLLPLEYALRTWLLSTAGVARDLAYMRGRLATARAAVLIRTAREIPQLLRERKALYRKTGRTTKRQLESLLEMKNEYSSIAKSSE